MAASHFPSLVKLPGSTAKSRPIARRAPAKPAGFETPVWSADRTGAVGPPTAVDAGEDAARSPAAVVHEALRSAFASLEVLERHAGHVAVAFRAGELAPARRGLTELMRTTGTFLRLATSAAQCADADLTSLCLVDGEAADEVMRDAVDHLISAQLAEDWTALARILDREYVPVLEAWRVVVERLAFIVDPGPQGEAA